MERYETLLACYLSGQMSEAQLETHRGEDEVFSRWLATRLFERVGRRKA